MSSRRISIISGLVRRPKDYALAKRALGIPEGLKLREDTVEIARIGALVRSSAFVNELLHTAHDLASACARLRRVEKTLRSTTTRLINGSLVSEAVWEERRTALLSAQTHFDQMVRATQTSLQKHDLKFRNQPSPDTLPIRFVGGWTALAAEMEASFDNPRKTSFDSRFVA